MPAVDSGCLVLADISGYTEYLGGVELEHCHDVLAKLMAAVAEQVRGALQVAKFEGDAIFCYDPHDRCDGEMLLATIDACYFAFARLRRDIEVNLTCPCDACRRVPGLDLKLIAHHGSFVEQRIGDSPELVGSDVVVAHRLLKNSVTDRTGLRGYALLSDACVQCLGLDVAALGLTEHRGSYESLGEVVCWIRDLEASWHEEQERAAVAVTAEDSDVTVTRDYPVLPAVLWEYCTSPQKKVLWRIADKRIEMGGGRPTRGVGQVTHCMMQAPYGVYVETCLDWKPYRYFTFSSRGRFGAFIYTTELEPLPDGSGTRGTTRFRALDRRERLTMRLFGRAQRRIWEQCADKLVEVLQEAARAAAEPPATQLAAERARQ